MLIRKTLSYIILLTLWDGYYYYLPFLRKKQRPREVVQITIVTPSTWQMWESDSDTRANVLKPFAIILPSVAGREIPGFRKLSSQFWDLLCQSSVCICGQVTSSLGAGLRASLIHGGMNKSHMPGLGNGLKKIIF